MKKLIAVLFLVQAVVARADWPADAGIDVPVSNVDTSESPAVIGDQQGGVFVVFAHQDPSPSATLRGEHFNAAGERLWSTANSDGGFIGKDLLGLSIGANNGGKSQAFTDTAGGFIAIYTPGKVGGPYTLDLQRFNENAVAQWTPTGLFGGVELLTNPYYYNVFRGIPDQTGGALVTYENGAGTLGQRVDSTGAIDYGTGYLFAAAQPVGVYYAPTYMDGDGQGGLYFIWPDTGSEDSSPVLDHLDPGGARTFEVSSVAPQYAPADNWTLSGLPDGGGSWAAWYQGTADAGLYLQLFASDGGAIFTDVSAANGLFVAAPAVIPSNPVLVSDGNGGVVLAWSDLVSSSLHVIYAQRFGVGGTPLWGAHPILVNSAETTPLQSSGYQPVFRVIPTPDNNVAFFWNTAPGIYAEKLAMDGGSKMWGALSGGVAVSTVAPAGIPWLDATFAVDDSAYVAYQTPAGAVYVKHVLADGTLGSTPATVDAGPTEDGGEGDGGLVDAGEDAGTSDAGPADAGSITDAGTDAGPADAGPILDAGVDAGGKAPDSGTTPDAGGAPDAGSTEPSSGCGCTSSGVGGAWTALLGLGLLMTRRRSRQRPNA
jgi:MYXO-CTERM domain-containing protein